MDQSTNASNPSSPSDVAGHTSASGHSEDPSSLSITSKVSNMNAAFGSCLSLVCPPIQYPPHTRITMQQDAVDLQEFEIRLNQFFLHAKEIELKLSSPSYQTTFLYTNNESLNTSNSDDEMTNNDNYSNGLIHETNEENEEFISINELEQEILYLEAELNEKNDLIEKYHEVARGWESKFRRLDHRMTPTTKVHTQETQE